MNAALRLWVDRWHVLGFPSLIPSAAWSEPELLAFWKAATELLGSKAGLLGWEELRVSFHRANGSHQRPIIRRFKQSHSIRTRGEILCYPFEPH